jgi:GntR family transcriptional regulator/MocR family aminotransferase
MILNGDLVSGQRLPSSRTLAKEINVSRTTILGAYDQLIAEGMIVSAVGAGSYVSHELAITQQSQKTPDQLSERISSEPILGKSSISAAHQYLPRLEHPNPDNPFITGLPALDAFPMSLWARLSAKCWREPRQGTLNYPEVSGLRELREAISVHLRANRGITCSADEVIVLNGAQQAFNRIGSTLLDPGDEVWFENPGTIGARNALISCGAKIIPVPVDAEGLDVKAATRKSANPRLIFTTPAQQHPLGIIMSLRRRLELLKAAETANAWIIEDDYVGEFHYNGCPPQTLKSVDRDGRVIYVGTFSKSLFPALRLGYMVAPPKLADTFSTIAEATLQGAPTHIQSVTARFIMEGHFTTHLRKMRKIYHERQQALIQSCQQHLKDKLTVLPTDAGLHTIATLAKGYNEQAISERSAEIGLPLTPISRFCLEPAQQSGLVIGFSTVPPRAIDLAVQRLVEIF